MGNFATRFRSFSDVVLSLQGNSFGGRESHPHIKKYIG
jgi:hypothetical protein